ncbi:hypothetical protein H6G74_04925 [Nostoc spongiaeforme FACHB-130]|uniref:Uncharacterized protein n=1 Tax=Nostoc spongiaeforme FACHB-130 TaxID=1357510 RepID=A0ABR8FRH9_9NOSO|nr:hypothetical protein [Nostoc spongiaeforme]MBD2593673.1 hypothetical protein [Nostoc spongiaeforme FACHB-130]
MLNRICDRCTYPESGFIGGVQPGFLTREKSRGVGRVGGVGGVGGW